jgi:hypothetical protein
MELCREPLPGSLFGLRFLVLRILALQFLKLALQLVEFFPATFQHFALNFEFFPCDQLELVQSARQQSAKVLFQVVA